MKTSIALSIQHTFKDFRRSFFSHLALILLGGKLSHGKQNLVKSSRVRTMITLFDTAFSQEKYLKFQFKLNKN